MFTSIWGRSVQLVSLTIRKQPLTVVVLNWQKQVMQYHLNIGMSLVTRLHIGAVRKML